VARLRSLMRHWLGIDALERKIQLQHEADVGRVLRVRAECAKETAALAQELLVSKRTTTQRAADTDADADPHLGGM
jgi:hypothetical protein